MKSIEQINKDSSDVQNAANKQREEGRLTFPSDLNLLADKALRDAIRELGWELAGVDMPESEKKRMYCEVVR